MGWWNRLGIMLLVTPLQSSWFRTETMQSTTTFFIFFVWVLVMARHIEQPG